MKQGSELAREHLRSQSRRTSPISASSMKNDGNSQRSINLTKTDIATLFTTMAGLYGPKWVKHYGLMDERNLWFAALSDLYPEQITMGLRKISRSNQEWPPSAPEFRKYCQPVPEDYGLPELSMAWKEANDHCHEFDQHKWSHRAVYLAGRFAGWFELKNACSDWEQKRSREKFEEEYHRLATRLMRNEELEPVKALENMTSERERMARQQQRDLMKQQGINPRGGRGEFLKRLAGMLK